MSQLSRLAAPATSIVILGLLAGLTASCADSRDEASVVVEGQGARVTIKRVTVHPFLAEYKRSLVVEPRGHPVVEMEMDLDTGGAQHVKVYRVGSGLLFLRDRFAAYEVQLGGRLTRLGSAPTPADAVFMGAFDKDAAGFLGGWRFIAARERREQPILGDTTSN